LPQKNEERFDFEGETGETAMAAGPQGTARRLDSPGLSGLKIGLEIRDPRAGAVFMLRRRLLIFARLARKKTG
jgi:hypothetical protein